jgi:hypothetical protein
VNRFRRRSRLFPGRRQLSWLPRLGAIALLLGGSVLPARGDKVPGLGPAWDAYYHSTDMNPVTVHFVERQDSFTPETARRQPVIATASIPRAYIYFASPYSQPAYPILPDEIWVRQLKIMLVDPQGEAYSVVWDRLRSEGLSQSAAKSQLRTLMARVQLDTSTLEDGSYTPYEAAASPIESKMNGVEEFSHGSSGPFFFRIPANPSLRIITCPFNIEKSHPSFFCDYEIRLSPDVRATASFVDFRLHGGSDFANERIANIREVLCGFVTCDPRWAATRTNTGGSR